MRKRILIVDDEIDTLGFLAERLAGYHYNVVSVDSGEKAIKLVKKSFYDIILMDINMPAMSGLEVFKQIKKISPLSSVIMMTAAASETMIKNAIEEGSFSVMYKPFKMEKVVETISEAIKRPIVLMVDDQFAGREEIEDLLEQKKCKVVTVADGYSALEVLKLGKPEVILVDIKMPQMDGFALLEKIKKSYPDICVIMMTAYSKEEYLKKSLEMGAYTYLYKPVQIEKVLEIIDKIRKEKRFSVLLVEDDANLSKAITFVLQENQYEVVSAENGNRAIEESKKKLYDASIIDFKLPDISGIEVIKKLKEVDPDMVILLITGYESLDIAMAAIKEHVHDFLIKPVDPEAIIKSLQEGLKAREK